MADILKIGNYVVPKVTVYKTNYPKLWSSDTGRNMKGHNKGTLIGIFTKLEVSIGKLSQAEAMKLMDAINVARVSVTYYDTQKGSLIREGFYFGDISSELVSFKKLTSKGISFSIIANYPREPQYMTVVERLYPQ